MRNDALRVPSSVADVGAGLVAPEVTVAMPARNAGRFIDEAIRSVLEQRGVDLELIVVDDGSSDDTAVVAESFRDERVTVLRNERRRGIGACHNIVLRRSRAPYVAHVDADDFLLPGALRTMIDALAGDPRAGQAHCYFFDVDAAGRTTRAAFRRRWRTFRRDRPPSLDYRSVLLSKSVANHLRTFPRAVLEDLGGFDETLPFGVDYDLALRLLERYEIKLVPAFLYARRVHDSNTTESMRFKAWRMWGRKYLIRRRLVRNGRISYVHGAATHLVPFLRGRLDAARAHRRRLFRPLRRAATALRWRLFAPAAARLRGRLTRASSSWPLVPARLPREAAPAPRIAYYVRQFPTLSETFIQREVACLLDLGLKVDVIAQNAQERAPFDEAAQRLAARTRYLAPIGERGVGHELRLFLRQRPLTVLRLSLSCFLHPQKPSRSGETLWRSALRLAGALRECEATHVHSPWAFPGTRVVLLAARLADVRFTMQPRASDIHRRASRNGLGERLRHADLIITNARYNLEPIRALLRGIDRDIHVIYEGVDPRRLRPPAERAPRGAAPLLLSVSRLVEPKGIDVLLRACRILTDQGRTVRCEIVGARIAAETGHYIALKKLHRALDLDRVVEFVGPRSFTDVSRKYEEADVYVLAAHEAADGRRDVTPNTLIEAMAMRLPIVSTRSGAIPELIEDEVSGLLVEPRDAEGLAAAIARVLDDAELRRRLGDAARRRVEERFDVTRNVRRYAELFGFPLPA